MKKSLSPLRLIRWRTYSYWLLVCRVVRIRRMREVNQEAVLLALCSKTFTSKVIIFRFSMMSSIFCWWSLLSNVNHSNGYTCAEYVFFVHWRPNWWTNLGPCELTILTKLKLYFSSSNLGIIRKFSLWSRIMCCLIVAAPPLQDWVGRSTLRSITVSA